MNVKRYMIGSIVVFVFIFLFDFLLHAVALKGCYEGIKHILRPEEGAGAFFFWVILSELILAFGLCCVFVKGYENRGIGEGIRFGLIIGIAFGVSAAIMHYAVYPVSGLIALSQAVGYVVEMIIAGIIIAAIYEPLPKSDAS
jgi:hypothetical protein